MSINEVRYLPECGSTNAYMKEHFEEFGPVGAVYTTNQTAGRGRLGRTWVNAEGKALYYTVAIKEPLAQPATLPLLASLAVRRQLALRYGVDCQIKWPNDLLLNGKKIVGILCESVCYGYQQQGRASCAALASTWPSRRVILMPPTCPTAPRWPCRVPRSIWSRIPAGWPRL